MHSWVHTISDGMVPNPLSRKVPHSGINTLQFLSKSTQYDHGLSVYTLPIKGGALP